MARRRKTREHEHGKTAAAGDGDIRPAQLVETSVALPNAVLPYFYKFTPIEQERLVTWTMKHKKKHKHHVRPRIILDEGNGIGTGVTIKCTKCRRKKELTDYSSW